ncbi:MAG TPA: DUF1269 domain-containing protein [Terriglobales bacterium]|nr:DUF1269 domain-containing protein [Terriglobales bacterium]HXY52250.1 DUF1269 domain-containing protein [Terriglobales bacterium]
MDRILVVVFSEASKAFEGRDALQELDHEDLLTLYTYAIITKTQDGKIVVNEEKDRVGLKTVLGSSLGSLIGLLVGPTGFAVGAMAGFLTGLVADLDNSRVSADFVAEVSRELKPGKFALVAEVNEDWTRWVDLRMAELGGVAYRQTLSEVKDAANSADIAAMKADLALLKAEQAEANADHKAKLYEKINQLEAKIQQQLEKAKERHEKAERRAKAKADVLKAKASATTTKAAETRA